MRFKILGILIIAVLLLGSIGYYFFMNAFTGTESVKGVNFYGKQYEYDNYKQTNSSLVGETSGQF